MGKQTKIHPVSLNVVRGAAEYVGFKLGKIRQVNYYEHLHTAVYNAVIEKIPPHLKDSSLNIIYDTLQNSVASDVNYIDVWKTPRGKIMARFETQPAGEEQPDWLATV